MVAVFFVLKQFVLRKDLIEQAKGISPGASVDEATRKRIKRAKVEIAILAILLLNGLRYIGSLPLWPLLVGVAVNLLMIAYEVQVVRRLKKSLP